MKKTIQLPESADEKVGVSFGESLPCTSSSSTVRQMAAGIAFRHSGI